MKKNILYINKHHLPHNDFLSQIFYFATHSSFITHSLHVHFFFFWSKETKNSNILLWSRIFYDSFYRDNINFTRSVIIEKKSFPHILPSESFVWIYIDYFNQQKKLSVVIFVR